MAQALLKTDEYLKIRLLRWFLWY